MKAKLFLLIIFIITIQSCKDETKQNVAEFEEKAINFPTYELIGEDESIVVESFDSTVVDINKFNHNNIVFKVGSEFTYSFEHVTNDKKIKYFKKTDGYGNWEFVDSDSLDFSTLQIIKISVANGNPMSNSIPDYSQTNLKYSLSDESSYSMSGVIENEANVWMHPPRDYYFEILELNPFPYVKAPFEIGNKWKWSLKIGDSWADERWKMWQGTIENKYEYEIVDKRKLETEIGELTCYEIKSNAKSRIGETELTAFFHEKYGFVRLNYKNIDGTKTNLELIEYSE